MRLSAAIRDMLGTENSHSRFQKSASINCSTETASTVAHRQSRNRSRQGDHPLLEMVSTA
jgi:hypothetical protein